MVIEDGKLSRENPDGVLDASGLAHKRPKLLRLHVYDAQYQYDSHNISSRLSTDSITSPFVLNSAKS